MGTNLLDIYEASKRIAPFVHRTPVLTSTALNNIVGAELYFKCENFQKVGAFKARGAVNAVLLLDPQQRKRGVATHSSGNHAQALAYAARKNGIECTVVMPKNSPQVKVDATCGYGARVVFCENNLESRESTLSRIIQETGATEIHPYNNNQVIAGQGTATLELLQDVTALDIVIAPVGGGGLLSGTAIAAKGVQPTITVLGAEPELAADAKESLRTGILQAPYPPITIADGLRTALCDRTLAYLQQHDVCILTAAEPTIERAMTLLMQRVKIVVEPSGATALAALLDNPEAIRGRKVGVIVSGGNTNLLTRL